MEIFIQGANQLADYTKRMRRDFHRHPELGFQEERTAAIVARELKALDLAVETGVGKTGVVGLLRGSLPGPVLLMRFDMDALPIQETTGAEYTSLNPGVMHACGHDGHTAIGLSVAQLLGGMKKEFPGTIKFVFQPAEELMLGAKRMVTDGALRSPEPNISLGVHLWNSRPVGWIGVTPGPVMSAADTFRIQIEGDGGHGAWPNLTKDPILAASTVVNAAQSIVSRNVSPLEAAVVSFTKFQGGDAFNVIPSAVELGGTIRSYRAEVRQLVMKRLQKIVDGVAGSMGCRAELSLVSSIPAVVNDPEIAAQVHTVVDQLLPDHELDTSERTMGSEDMSVFMERVPGCYIFIGSANTQLGLDAPHHNPRFDFDESVLPEAVALLSSTALQLLAAQ